MILPEHQNTFSYELRSHVFELNLLMPLKLTVKQEKKENTSVPLKCIEFKVSKIQKLR